MKTLSLLALLLIIPFIAATDGYQQPRTGFSVGNQVRVVDTAVYHTGFASTNGSTWEEFSLTGNKRGNWIIGEASANPRLENKRYVAIFSCTWSSGWNCGDNWQLLDRGEQDTSEPQEYQDSMQGDFEALQDIYQQMNGSIWDENTGWQDMTPESMNQAYGIEVNANRRVTRVDLENNNLHGGLPDSIGNLNNIQYFSIKRNPVYSRVPQSIENWADVEYIMLSGREGVPGRNPHPGKTYGWGIAKYYGTLPDVFDKMPKLKVIDFFWNKDMEEQPYPSTLYQHDTITHILLSGNQFTGELEDNFNLPELDVMHLGDNKLEGELPSTLSKSTKMRKLHIHYSDWSARNSATTFFSGTIPPEYAKLTNMEFLYLGHQELEGKIPEFMFQNWTGLRELGVSHNNFYGPVPKELGKFDLIILDLAGNNFGVDKDGNALPLEAGGSLPPEIVSGMQRIILFDIRRNNLRGNYPDGQMVDGEWKGWKTKLRARTMVIDKNEFTGSLPEAPDYTGDMSLLIMDGNLFSGEIPRSWVNFFIPTWWDPKDRGKDDTGKGQNINISTEGDTLSWSGGDWDGQPIDSGTYALQEDEVHYLYFDGDTLSVNTSLAEIGTVDQIKNNVAVVAWPVNGQDAYVNSNLRDTNKRRVLNSIQIRNNNVNETVLPEWFSNDYLVSNAGGGGVDILGN